MEVTLLLHMSTVVYKISELFFRDRRRSLRRPFVMDADIRVRRNFRERSSVVGRGSEALAPFRALGGP